MSCLNDSFIRLHINTGKGIHLEKFGKRVNNQVYIENHHILLCGASHVNSRSRSVGSLCDGEVYSDPATVQLHAIGPLFCLEGHRQKLIKEIKEKEIKK